jgi:putative hemolysin
MTEPALSARIARDISYASAATSRAGRAVIRALEGATGRGRLIARARGYDQDLAQGGEFWSVIAARYGLSLDLAGGSLDLVPDKGALVLVANHPYGVLDGLMMGHILAARRGRDFRILANSVFRRSADLNETILPISFDGTKAAQAMNLETRARALEWLAGGGALGVFPGGTVSTSARPLKGPPRDPAWRTFTAKLISRSGATVVPVFFDGQNSRLFQIASHLHTNLRLGLLLREFRARIDNPVRVVIGQPLDATPYRGDARALMDFLRQQTYALCPRPIDPTELGHDFEAKGRAGDGGRDFRFGAGRADRP